MKHIGTDNKPMAAHASEKESPGTASLALPIDVDAWFPLSSMQEAYLVGQSDSYHIGNIPCLAYFVFDVGDIDADRFEKAWNAVVARHAALRSIFSLELGQHVLETVPPVRIERFGQIEERAVVERFSQKKHDAGTWPLFQCGFSTTPQGRWRFHAEFNVLAADGDSIQLIFSELLQCYRGYEHLLPVLRYSFRDYCTRLSRLRSRGSDLSDSYWQQRLRGASGPPGLPLACHPSELDRPTFRRLQTMLDRIGWQNLKAQATQRNLSPTAVFLASYCLTLAAWSRHKAFVLGVTTFQRPEWHPQINHIVGDFTGLLPFCVEVAGQSTFSEQAETLQKTLWTDLSNFGSTSTMSLRQQLNREQDDRVRGLPVVFTSLLGKTASVEDWVLVGGITQTPQVWIDHQVVETAEGVLLCWDAVEGLWPEGLLEEMFSHHCERLEALARGTGWESSRPSTEPSTLDQPAAEGLLPIYPPAHFGDRIAVVTPELTLSHAQVARYAVSTAAALLAAGAKKGDRVAVVMHKGWEQVVATLATTQAGLVYVPISPDLPIARVHQLFARCDINMALTQSAWSGEGLLPPECRCITIPGNDDARAGGLGESRTVDDLAYVIFTSGSTGQPKGVAMRQGAVHNTIVDINRRFGVTETDRVLSISSLSFDLSVYDIFGLVAVGGAVVLPGADDLRDPQAWVALMEHANVTVWNTVPALMLMLVEYLETSNAIAPRSLRLVLLSGDWIPTTLPSRIEALFEGVRVVSLGGATEAAIWSVYHGIDQVDPSWTSIPYGKALGGQTIDVYDDELLRLPDWVTGEICIGGHGLANGYWRDEAQTEDRFVVDSHGIRLYRTGDLGRRMPGGTIELLGREDGQVKINGFRIELKEIETALEAYEDIQASCVVVRDKRIVAYVASSPDSLFNEQEQLARLRQQLPSYLIPHRILCVEEIPLSSNGKVDRDALPQPDELAAPKSEALTETQRGVCEAVAEILGCCFPCLEDDFFRLGGTSIQLIRLHRRLRERFDVDCALREVVADTRVVALAELIWRKQGSGTSVEESVFVCGTSLDEEFPMLPLQQAYWLGRRNDLDLGGLAPHIYLELEVPDLDVDRCQRAWNALVQRHPALRTVFTEDARQRVLGSVPNIEIAIVDLRGENGDMVASRRDQLRQRLSHQVLDPGVWPLFEFAVSRDDVGTRWHISMDLLIGDAWSMQILMREFAQLYHAPNRILPTLSASFKDWVLWREAHAHSAKRECSRQFWRHKLGDLPAAPSLRARRDEVQSARKFQRCRHIFSNASWSSLRSRAADNGLTAVCTLLSAFCAVLRRGGADERFLLSATFFDRDDVHPDIRHLVGDFTSLMLLPCAWQDRNDFLANAKVIQSSLFEIMEHADLSAIEVIRMAASHRAITAPVVFTSTLDISESDGSVSDFPAKEIFSLSQTPQVWLDHQVSEEAGALVVTWDFRSDLFDYDAIHTLFNSYVAAIEALAEGSEGAWVSKVPLLGGKEQTPATNPASDYMSMYRSRPALRRGMDFEITLPSEKRAQRLALQRNSSKSFYQRAISQEAFGALLDCLADVPHADRFVPKRAYGSAGSLYPVQIYVSLQHGNVEGLDAGTYYYNPDRHALNRTGEACEFPSASALKDGFAIMLVACMDAIEPIYGERSRDFALIEAGLIAQTLETWAPQYGIGMCQVGWPAPHGWNNAVGAADGHVYLHTIVGGATAAEHDETPAVEAETQGEQANLSRTNAPAFGEIERLRDVLAGILSEVLGGAEMKADTNFFRSGGDSVHAVRASGRASRILGFSAPLRDLLENPTPQGWADALLHRHRLPGAANTELRL
ncbi:non-ribosomal peptide synthetase [Dyella sp. GSA-30]|uniref:non-ribosomal peptide synthetase n=1 Tax=Dyella sp. GSA-30 TaxID=2994496 RepID=UPI00248FA9CF|nr:non-ribosomal peptide synthetase [Dyella sp. GSA-30]